jgi:hypothetical protein
MKTKLEILARLLQDKHITVEEFTILAGKEVQYIYWNYPHYVQPYTSPVRWGTTADKITISAEDIYKNLSGNLKNRNRQYSTTNLMSYTADGNTKS